MNEKLPTTRLNNLGPIIRRAKQAIKQSGLFVLGFDAAPSVALARDHVIHQLGSYGFTPIQFFYAFPKVILPRAVFSEDAVQAAKKSYGYWAAFSLKDAGEAAINELHVAGSSLQGHLDEIATGCYILATREASAMPVVRWH